MLKSPRLTTYGELKAGEDRLALILGTLDTWRHDGLGQRDGRLIGAQNASAFCDDRLPGAGSSSRSA